MVDSKAAIRASRSRREREGPDAPTSGPPAASPASRYLTVTFTGFDTVSPFAFANTATSV